MTEIPVRAQGRASLADAIAAAAGALFVGICLFCAAGALVWAVCFMAGLPMIVIGTAEVITAVMCLAVVWLLFRAGLRYAASGFASG